MAKLQHDIYAFNYEIFFTSIFVIINELSSQYMICVLKTFPLPVTIYIYIYRVHYHSVFTFMGKGLNN